MEGCVNLTHPKAAARPYYDNKLIILLRIADTQIGACRRVVNLYLNT